MHLNNIFKELLRDKKLVLLIGLLILGIILIAAFSQPNNQELEKAEDLEAYKIRMEAELSKLCSSVEGVGKCTVTLSFKEGMKNTYKGTKLTESRPPEVLGVIVVCRGAERDSVRSELTKLFTSLFDIPSNRVAVLKLN